MGITLSTAVWNGDHALLVHGETQTDSENIAFMFAPAFVPCDSFGEILRMSPPKEREKNINKNHFFYLENVL